MPTEVLEIAITGDNKAAIAAFQQTENQLRKFQTALKQATDTKHIEYLNRSIDILKQKSAQLGAEMGKTGATVAKSSQNYMNFGRVLQDLPYGFTGIQNNLTQLIPSVGALGLAFSGVISILTFASVGFGAWTRGSKDAKEATDKLNESLHEGRENAEGEVSNMKAYAAAAANTTLSMSQRLTAVKKLRDEYPAYFKDLTNEQILTGEITKATDSLTQAIYKRAEARAREADIARKATQVFENEQKIHKLDADMAKALENKKNANTYAGSTEGGIDLSKSQVYGIQAENLLKEKNKLLDQNHELMFDIANSQVRVNSLTAASIDLDTKETKGIKEKDTALRDYLKTLDLTIIKRPKSPGFIVENNREQGAIPKKLEGGMGVFGDEMAPKRAADLKKLNQELAVSAQLAQIGSDAFGSLFNAMAQGESIGEAITNVFKDLVKQIAVAVAKAITFAIILNVITGGAYSIGKIFVGALGGNFTGKGYAGGGLSTGPKSGHMELLHGDEWVLRPDQLNGSLQAAYSAGSMNGGMGGGSQTMNIEGMIRGNDIYLSKSRVDYQRGLTTGIR